MNKKRKRVREVEDLWHKATCAPKNKRVDTQQQIAFFAQNPLANIDLGDMDIEV